MNVVVCVKVVKGELNPFDECALECALQIENTRVTVVSMGAPTTKTALERISRLGLDRIILLSDNGLAGSDTLATSYALSCVIRTLSPSLVLCGRQSIDGDTAQVGPCLAQMLGYSVITHCMNISVRDTVNCQTRQGAEQTALPAVLTVERMNTLRFPRIGSKPKEVEIHAASDYAIDLSRCGVVGSPTKVLETFESSRGMRKCKFISFAELDECIASALQKAKEETKPPENGPKAETITVIGRDLAEIGKRYAQNVRVIESRDVYEIAKQVQNDTAVLWKADLWGRRNAPRVAALLHTGLCADCTALMWSGDKLHMIRPTFGGTKTAKIECRTKPQMATVHVEESENGLSEKNDIVFAFGRGAKADLERYKALAQKYNAAFAASRALVDMGCMGYEYQVGLTGKTVSPKVYVACGISGAVQHTVGFENAGTVIAINPDRNARIFDFADFGIVGKIE